MVVVGHLATSGISGSNSLGVNITGVIKNGAVINRPLWI